MRLDKSRPYGHVHGLPGVVFSQNGRHFAGNGMEVADPETEVEQRVVPTITQPTEPTVIQLEPTLKVGPDDMRLAANKALRFQMESFGEPWQGVEHARKFLGVKE